MMRVQMQRMLHYEVIMGWNRTGTLANPFSHSRRPATPLAQAATHIVYPHVLPLPLIRTSLLRHG
jgi:hypothetical protein